ncbi:MAG: DUF86 domain-containing protein [Anaerolineae bacterium]
MKKDNTVYLRHIRDAIQRVERHLAGVSWEQFLRNELVQDAVVRQLEIIGEATRNLSDDFRRGHPEVAWRQIIGMRNRLIHAYFKVDLGIVWEITHVDLPLLKEQVERFLEEKATD